MRRFGDATAAAGAAVRADPLRESAHGALIRVHLAEGNQSEALRAFDRFSHLLQADLGLVPTPQLHELVAGLLEADISSGFEASMTLTQVAAVSKTVETWLDDILTTNRPRKRRWLPPSADGRRYDILRPRRQPWPDTRCDSGAGPYPDG